MRIEPGGNVGIGGTAANYQLHCTTGIGVGGHGLNNQQLSITNNAIQSLNLGVGYTNLSLNALGGNVGISESSPINKLTISNTAGQDDAIGNVQIRYTGTTTTINSGLDNLRKLERTKLFLHYPKDNLPLPVR